MSRAGLVAGLACCLLLSLAACGNKGPLVQAPDEQPKKTETVVQ